MTQQERWTSLEQWFFGKDYSKTDPNWKSLDDLEKVPGWYFAAVLLGFFVAFAGAIILGSYLNGARWINKKNYRVEGKEFTRSLTQNLIYKLSIAVLALLVLFVGYMGTFSDYVDDAKSGGKQGLLLLIPFFRSGGSLMFQCNIAAVFILPWLMFFRRTRAIAIIAPFTFIGAMTTVFSQSDLASGNGFDGFEVHRKATEHILLMVLPLFVMVANRFQFTTKSLLGSILYTIAFNLAVATYVYVEKMGDTGLPSQGEFGRAGEMLGLTQEWMHNHFWTLVVLIQGPIAFLMIAVLWFIYNFVYYASTTKIQTEKSSLPYAKFAKPFAMFGKKFITGPIQWAKQFKEVEKASWIEWSQRYTKFVSR